MNYTSGITISNRIVARIESTPGYTTDKSVAIIGLPKVNEFGYGVIGGYDVTTNMTGIE